MKKILVIPIVIFLITLPATLSIAYELGGLDIHGFISEGYLLSDDTNFVQESDENSSFYGEMGINFAKDLNDRLRFGIQLFSQKIENLNNNEVLIDWAYVDYRLHEIFGVRFGQVKFPHGLYNEVRDIDMLRTPIFLPDSVYQEVSYDLYANDAVLSLQGISSRELYLSLQGLGLYGYIDLDVVGGLTYQAMYGTQNIEPDSKITERQIDYLNTKTPFTNLSDDSFENEKVEVDFKYAGNVLWDTPIEGLRIGFSIDNVKMSASSRLTDDLTVEIDGREITIINSDEIIKTNYDKIENKVYSAEYTWDNFNLTAEYILTTKEYELESEAFKNLPISSAAENSTATGWYIAGSYHFIDWFEFGCYYSKSNFDNDKQSNTDYSVYFFSGLDDICATARFDIDRNWAFKLETHRLKGTYPVNDLSSDLTNITSTKVEEEWYLYAAKMTFAF